MVGCGGNTAPPIKCPPKTVSETVITEPSTETTPSITVVEPTEKGKVPTPTASKGRATVLTVTATEPTVTTKSTEPSVAENTEAGKETPPETEEPQEEIYQGIQWPEANLQILKCS